MSVGLIIASDGRLEEVKNPYYRTLSIDQALSQGIQVDDSLLDGTVNQDEPDVVLVMDYNLIVDESGVNDGDADDNYALLDFDGVRHYSKRKNGVYIEWHYYTKNRAERIVEYIKNALSSTDCVEVWKVWLSDYNPPMVKRVDLHIDELRSESIKAVVEHELWDNADPDTPTYYCLSVYR